MSSNIKRKLAAIMFTDIVGYTEQMSKDEEKAFALIQKKRKLLIPLIKKYEGKLIKEIGDGTLTRYFKADNAIECASIFQSKTDANLNVRAGIHTGEVIVDKEDVFGDVVNVASRLESIAVPGSVFVSKETIDKLDMSKSFKFVSIGMQSLKGVGRLIEVYAINDESLVVPNPEDYRENKIDVHSDDEVPSIAIIPFENKGADEDMFYAYGISLDLISDVSSAGLIRVASKKQIEDAGDLPQYELVKKLDVRYIANGELWRMGDMFQLSVELYDTKDKKVVWSDRWQEKWDNMPIIKMNLTDGLLKALDTTSKVERKVETINTKAYELYLKAKHIYEKRIDTNDTDKARELLDQAIKRDDNLISAKALLGFTYMQMGDYDKSMEIYTFALKQAEELSNKSGIGYCMEKIGNVHFYKGDLELALDYYERSMTIHDELCNKKAKQGTLTNIGVTYYNKGDLETAINYYDRALEIAEEFCSKYESLNLRGNIGLISLKKGDYDKALECFISAFGIRQDIGDKYGMGKSLNYIGDAYKQKGDYEKALDYYDRSLAIREEISDKRGISIILNHIGNVYDYKGDYDKALDCYGRSLEIKEELGASSGAGYSLSRIGYTNYHKGDYRKSQYYLEKSLSIQREISFKGLELETTTYLYLCYTHLGKIYDKKDIRNLIKYSENIEFELNLRIYQLLDNTSYLDKAYKQVQDSASQMEEELGKIFLNYPIPKQIIGKWKKLNN